MHEMATKRQKKRNFSKAELDVVFSHIMPIKTNKTLFISLAAPENDRKGELCVN